MSEKVTEMRLRVDDLQSSSYKKLKKILYKFPQIRDQVYDMSNNIVRIIVVCSNPEKIRDKLRCKGGKVIRSIQIVVPPPPQPPKPAPVPPPKPEKPKEPVKPKEPPRLAPVPPPKPEKPKDPEKPKVPKPPPAPAPNPPPLKPVPVPTFPIGVCCRQYYEGYPGGPGFEGCRRTVTPPPCYEGYPGGPCFEGCRRTVPPPPCYEGYPGGPGFEGCRRTVPPPPCYEGYPRGPCFEGYRRPVPPPPCYDYYGYGYNRGCYVSRCDQYSATRTLRPAQSSNPSAGHYNIYFHCLPKTNVGTITLWTILSILTYIYIYNVPKI